MCVHYETICKFILFPERDVRRQRQVRHRRLAHPQRDQPLHDRDQCYKTIFAPPNWRLYDFAQNLNA